MGIISISALILIGIQFLRSKKIIVQHYLDLAISVRTLLLHITTCNFTPRTPLSIAPARSLSYVYTLTVKVKFGTSISKIDLSARRTLGNYGVIAPTISRS